MFIRLRRPLIFTTFLIFAVFAVLAPSLGGSTTRADEPMSWPLSVYIAASPDRRDWPAENTPTANHPLAEIEIADFAGQVIALANQQRITNGLSPLAAHASLINAAQSHTDDMVEHNFFSHTGSDGSTPAERVVRAGYGFSAMGENIAAGYDSPSAVMNGWMNSSGHRANILNSSYQHIGVGYRYDEKTTYGHYWTMDLGAPRDGEATITPFPTSTSTWTVLPTQTRPATPTHTGQPTRIPSSTPTSTWTLLPTRTRSATPTPTRQSTRTPPSTQTPTVYPAANHYVFAGHVYLADARTGIAGAKVILYRWRQGLWVLVSERATGSRGEWGFSYIGPDQRFALVEHNLADYASVSASASSPGQVLDPDWVVFDMSAGQGSATVDFYDSAPPTPPTETPTVTLTPTVTSTATPTPVPTVVQLRQGANGYQRVQDTYLDAWFPEIDHASDHILRIRSGDVRSVLIRFDLQAISPQARVIEATLRFHILGASRNSPLPVEVYGLLQPWAASPPAASSSAREASPTARAILAGTKVWVAFTLTDLVQRWVSRPETNYGALLRGDSDVALEYELASSDHTVAGLRPELVVSYCLPSEHPPSPSPTIAPQTTPQTRLFRQGLDGYAGVCDTHLDAWASDRNFARERTVSVRSGDIRSALLRFDLSGLPADAVVLEATLYLHISGRSNPLSLPVEVYGVRRPWDCVSATWKQATAEQPWSQPGAGDIFLDRDPLPLSRATLSQVNAWTLLDITEAVRRWVRNPVGNHGLLIKGGGDVSVEYHLTSSDYANENLRPKLEVIYALP